MANLITIARFPVLILAIVLLYLPSAPAKLASVPLLILLIVMDSLDGYVARSRNETSLLGSVLDIMADRAVELALWIVFAHLRLVPVVIPLIFVVRGVAVDSVRSVGISRGVAPFSTMRTRVGKWLVGSPWMRSSYAIIKAISFAGLALTNALAAFAKGAAVPPDWVTTAHTIFTVTTWIALVLCLARGIPVVAEAASNLKEIERGGPTAS
ncbi:MAG: CDP-alcohol phosphatidyltransferase family protein [Chloroflexi bacterium]|nr:CDP-alcohol phosphatidyltransferase family protein [Chloroflexota bacterium]